jgi:hypothetical protein
MHILSKIAAAASAVMALAAGAPAQAGLITNGTFSDSSNQPSLAGWTANGGLEAVAEDSYSDCCGALNPGPNNLAAFGGGGTSGGVLSQSFTTVVGQAYMLTFLYGTFGDDEPQSLAVSAGSLLTTVTDQTGSYDFSNLFNAESFDFIATDVTTTLTFTDVSLSGDSADGLLENVAVSPVPEPASFALLGFGAAMLCAALRHNAHGGSRKEAVLF